MKSLIWKYKELKLSKLFPPVGFMFEETEPEDVIYKLEYKNAVAEFDCNQMYKDYGWDRPLKIWYTHFYEKT